MKLRLLVAAIGLILAVTGRFWVNNPEENVSTLLTILSVLAGAMTVYLLVAITQMFSTPKSMWVILCVLFEALALSPIVIWVLNLEVLVDEVDEDVLIPLLGNTLLFAALANAMAVAEGARAFTTDLNPTVIRQRTVREVRRARSRLGPSSTTTTQTITEIVEPAQTPVPVARRAQTTAPPRDELSITYWFPNESDRNGYRTFREVVDFFEKTPAMTREGGHAYVHDHRIWQQTDSLPEAELVAIEHRAAIAHQEIDRIADAREAAQAARRTATPEIVRPTTPRPERRSISHGDGPNDPPARPVEEMPPLLRMRETLSVPPTYNQTLEAFELGSIDWLKAFRRLNRYHEYQATEVIGLDPMETLADYKKAVEKLNEASDRIYGTTEEQIQRALRQITSRGDTIPEGTFDEDNLPPRRRPGGPLHERPFTPLGPDLKFDPDDEWDPDEPPAPTVTEEEAIEAAFPDPSDPEPPSIAQLSALHERQQMTAGEVVVGAVEYREWTARHKPEQLSTVRRDVNALMKKVRSTEQDQQPLEADATEAPAEDHDEHPSDPHPDVPNALRDNTDLNDGTPERTV